MELERFSGKAQAAPAQDFGSGVHDLSCRRFQGAWKWGFAGFVRCAALAGLSVVFWLFPGMWAWGAIAALWACAGLGAAQLKSLRLELTYGAGGVEKISRKALFGSREVDAKSAAGWRWAGRDKRAVALEAPGGKKLMLLSLGAYDPPLLPQRDFAGLPDLDMEEQSLALEKILGPKALPGAEQMHARELKFWKSVWLAVSAACAAGALYSRFAPALSVGPLAVAAVCLAAAWPAAALALLYARPRHFCLAGANDPRVSAASAFIFGALWAAGAGLEKADGILWATPAAVAFGLAAFGCAAFFGLRSAKVLWTGKDKLWLALAGLSAAWCWYGAADALTLAPTGRVWELQVESVSRVGGKHPHLSVRLEDSGQAGVPRRFDAPQSDAGIWKEGASSALAIEFSDAFGSRSYAFANAGLWRERELEMQSASGR